MDTAGVHFHAVWLGLKGPSEKGDQAMCYEFHNP